MALLQAVPIYISEMSPPKMRGALNIMFQLATTMGIAGASVINYRKHFGAPDLHMTGMPAHINPSRMHQGAMLPCWACSGAGCRVGLAPVAWPGSRARDRLLRRQLHAERQPQQPAAESQGREGAQGRHSVAFTLMHAGQKSSCSAEQHVMMQQVLVRMRGTENVAAEWQDIQAAVEELRAHDVAFWASLGVLFSPRYWKPALASVAVPAFQQLTGINAIMFFAPQIFQVLGMVRLLRHSSPQPMPCVQSTWACCITASGHHLCLALMPTGRQGLPHVQPDHQRREPLRHFHQHHHRGQVSVAHEPAAAWTPVACSVPQNKCTMLLERLPHCSWHAERASFLAAGWAGSRSSMWQGSPCSSCRPPLPRSRASPSQAQRCLQGLLTCCWPLCASSRHASPSGTLHLPRLCNVITQKAESVDNHFRCCTSWGPLGWLVPSGEAGSASALLHGAGGQVGLGAEILCMRLDRDSPS